MTDGERTYNPARADARDTESELDELIAEIHDNAAMPPHETTEESASFDTVAETSAAFNAAADATGAPSNLSSGEFETAAADYAAGFAAPQDASAFPLHAEVVASQELVNDATDSVVTADATATAEQADAQPSLRTVNQASPDPFAPDYTPAHQAEETAAHAAAPVVPTAPVQSVEADAAIGNAPAQSTEAVAAGSAFPAAPAQPVDAVAAPGASSVYEEVPLPSGPASASPEELDPADTGELPLMPPVGEHASAPSPEDTAEIDLQEVEAKLSDPGTTQSFAPITEERIDTSSTFDAGTTTSLMWGARSDVGCVRSHNEDSYLVASPLFAVCDGMGGHAAGEVASSIAVETIAKMAPSTADAAALAAAVEAANAAVIEAAMNGVGRPGMGCTATCAYIENNTVAIAHVGDSRAYLLHEGTLIRITRDHSYVEELVDAGEITADEARIHPNRSVITRALGSDPAMYADHFTLNIQKGDRLILCSDGLSSMIGDGEIEDIAGKSSTAQMCTDNLVDAALAAGGGDNVSVVVVDVVDDGRLKSIAKRRRRNAIIALAALAAAVVVATVAIALSITHSVYLGVKDDAVAVYRGVPGDFLGMELHWLEDETSIELDNLPEDTQNRLREGIPQASMEEATQTVDDYREQIDAQKTESAQNAQTIENAKAEARAGGLDEGADGQADTSEAEGNDQDTSTPLTPTTPNDAEHAPETTTQGGTR